jgi:hypothetical protein
MKLVALGLLLTCGTVGTQAIDARIWVDVEINKQPVKFIFDTGAGGTILFDFAATRLNIKSTPPPEDAVIPAGMTAYSLSEPVDLTIFNQTLPGVQLAVVNSPFPNLESVDGVIGWPNLRDNRIHLTGRDLHFRFAAEIPAETSSWIQLKELPASRVLVFELPQHDSDSPSYLGIDTGSPHGIRLNPRAWAQWREENPQAPRTVTAYVMTVQGLVVAEEAWAEQLELGGLKFTDIPVGPMNMQEIQSYPSGTLAVAGLQALRRIDAYFDGKTHTLSVNPLNSPPPGYTHNMLGAVFTPASPASDKLVARVSDHGPATDAGIRNGDILLKIDDLDVTPWRTTPGILPLSRYFAQEPGTVLRLTLEREGETFIVPVVLKTILGPQ